MKHDSTASGADAGPELTAELRRLARLFLLSAVTLALFLLRTAVTALPVPSVPQSVSVAWSILLLAGWASTWALALYTTIRARRWGWVTLAAIPLTCVPVGVAYAWIRRGEIEEAVLGRRRARKTRG